MYVWVFLILQVSHEGLNERFDTKCFWGFKVTYPKINKILQQWRKLTYYLYDTINNDYWDIRVPCFPFINDMSCLWWCHQAGSKRKDKNQTLSKSCCEFMALQIFSFFLSFLKIVREGHLLSCSLTSALAVPLKILWLMVRALISAGGSVVLRSSRGGNEEKRGGNSVWRRNTTLCRSFTAQVMTKQPSVMIGPCGLFCLAASSSRGDDRFWDRGSDLMFLQQDG